MGLGRAEGVQRAEGSDGLKGSKGPRGSDNTSRLRGYLKKKKKKTHTIVWPLIPEDARIQPNYKQ